MTEFDEFERRLAAAIRSDADASVGPFTPESVADAAIADSQSGAKRLPRGSTRQARRFGRGRDMTLLAAAFLLVGGALAVGSGVVRLPSVVPPAPAPSFGLIATPSSGTTSPGPSDLAGPSASPLPAAGPGGAWVATGTMGTPRWAQTAVRLVDGRVLVVGGNGDVESDPATAEVYDPASGTWSATGTMLKPQAGFPPTLLRDGKVLVGDSDDARSDIGAIGAEVYDPASGVWSSAGKACTFEGAGATATLLHDGKVLVACLGGAQVYDPDRGAWSATGTMITPRQDHTATLLPDGKVLVAGGDDGGDSPPGEAEIYDPDTGSWTAIPSCVGCGWATLLPDGTVLVVRGPGKYTPLAEIYDPATVTWTVLAVPTEFGVPMALLSDGTVLLTSVRGPTEVTGSPEAPCTAAALYDPRTGSSTTAASMLRCRNGSFTLLLDSTVLVAGGSDCNNDGVCVPTGAAELYVPAGVSPPPLPPFPSPPPPDFSTPVPTPEPTPLPPAAGPVPPNARTWKVTVDNESSEPVTLSVAAADGTGPLELVGSATPNVVPAGATVKVTFLFPVNGGRADGWIVVDMRPGNWSTGDFEAADIGMPGKIVITPDGQTTWLSP